MPPGQPDMSSSKRRKLDAQPPPQQPSPVSAISALAARRRLAGNPPPREPSSSPEPEDAPLPRTNAFSVLQNLNSKTKNESPKPKPKSSKKGPKAISQKPELRSAQRPITESESNTPDSSAAAPKVSYSSFVPSKSNCRKASNGVIHLRLGEGERFLVLGSYGIKVLTGQITVSGATLRPSDQIRWVHAPHCHAVPVLRTSERSSLELHSDPNSLGLRKLDRLSPYFRNIWNEPPSGTDEAKLGHGKTFQIVCTSDDGPENKSIIPELSSPPEWNKKLASLEASPASGGMSPSTILICGPKSSGKSTFSRLLTNRLLTSDSNSRRSSPCGVAVLDLDPGQPEYTPPGLVSLVHVTQPNLGVPFTHPSLGDPAYRVIRCHALASITPASSPDHYLECALDLLATSRRELRNSHLLINTPGWILGTGLDLLAEMTSRMNPTEVIYMSEEGPAETVDSLRVVTKKTFTTLPSQPSDIVYRTAIHLRTMSNMSYFHLLRNDSPDAAPRLGWNPSPLTSMRPMQVRYSGPRSGILGILTYDFQSPPDLLADSINGMIVAAVDIEDRLAFRSILKEEDAVNLATSGSPQPPGILRSESSEGIPCIPNADGISLDPRYSRTIGLVLIRGVDNSNSTLQILTPINPQQIQEIRSQQRDIVLVHGKFDTPTWAYTEDLYERSGQDAAIEKSASTITSADDVVDDDQRDDDNGDDDDDDDDKETNHLDGGAPLRGSGSAGSPWVEVLRRNEKRPVGSRTWRVRRDLGRSQGD